MNINLPVLSSNSGNHQLNRNELLSEYERFLEKAKVNKEHIVKYASLLYPQEYNNLLQKVDGDIAFADRKILELSIPSVSASVPAEVLPEAPSLPVLPAEVNTGNDNAWWAVGAVIGGLVAVPLVVSWASKNPEKNLATIQDVLKIIKMTSGYGRS